MNGWPGPAAVFLTAIVAAACAPIPTESNEPSVTIEAAPPVVADRRDLPRGPLSARERPLVFWSGSEALVLGGSDAPPCPPNADCAGPNVPPLRDGAAFDIEAEAWRQLADAPVPLGPASGALVDGTLWLNVFGFPPGNEVGSALLAYDIAGDSWREVDAPDAAGLGSISLAAGSRLVFAQPTQEEGFVPDRWFDPATGRWGDIPADPLRPAFDRAVVWTGSQLVLVAVPLSRLQEAGPPRYAAAVYDPATGEWERLADPDIVGSGPDWWWTGGAVVNAHVGTSDGGEVNNWGRSFPHGGVLDPDTGWQLLPNAPAEADPFVGVNAAGKEHVVADGWILHVPTGHWTALPLPRPGQITSTGAAWAGDALFAWGGVHWNGTQGELLDTGWLFTP